MTDGTTDSTRGATPTGTTRRIVFVLGMHRSGTSCLVACLERSGLALGTVERYNFDQPQGNLERGDALAVNDALLERVGGSWTNPPTAPIAPSPADDAAVREVVERLEATAPAALKDPRLLLTIDCWLPAAADPRLVGTFRHPDAVARSLWQRSRMPAADAHRLWCRYNERLVDLHRRERFPLVEFDLSDPDVYLGAVAGAAAELGFTPDRGALRRVVGEHYAHTQLPVDSPVPDECAELYSYLRTHRFRAEPRPVAGRTRTRREWRDVERDAWHAARRLPRPLRGVVKQLYNLRQRPRIRR